MKFSLVRSSLVLASVVSTITAHAHPGHDDHELTWDLNHLAAHPGATAGCVAALLVLLAAAWIICRRVRQPSQTD